MLRQTDQLRHELSIIFIHQLDPTDILDSCLPTYESQYMSDYAIYS